MKDWQKNQKMSAEDRRNFQKAGALFALAIASLVVGWYRTSASLDARNAERTGNSVCAGNNAFDHAVCMRNSIGR